jgi:valyl-tRNA synthetase
MNEKFLKPYDPNQTESKIYQLWLDSGFFNPDTSIAKGLIKEDAPAYSIVLPPPNVTGVLHTGHALTASIEDAYVRFYRMQGYRTLWVPGTDHAAIATQSKVEKEIQKKEGKSKYDLGKEELLKRVRTYAQESHDTIVHQIKSMGASLDWSREAFTLDEKRNKAVRIVFKKMYEDGLIYRGHRIVNWDPKGQTVISDDEIVYKEEKTKFYYFKYGPFVIGTSRPETKFGDKYVVMHPKDERYKEYTHGQQIDLEWINGPITATVIKDESIDMEFGTGVMTITPWHSAVDFEIAGRHNLDKEQIIDERGKLLPIAGEFAGMKITEAREKIVEKLRSKGLVEKEEDYTHNISTAERTGGIIEPQIKLQWFINVNKEFILENSKIKNIPSGSKTTLKEIMRKTVDSGQIQIIPDYFNKTYFHWIDNLGDWCISRQIWYGHQIPVWYKGDEIKVSIEDVNEEGWIQDEDTLDTWFSSGLWTFSTLGWPEETEDFKTYHPTSLLETGSDLIFFWVARMILMAGYNLGDIPFEKIYFHGLIRDNQGRKISKSLGNATDPLELCQKFGTDALRMSMVVGNSPGMESKIIEDKIKAYKHFANKLWNITRFILQNTEGINFDSDFKNWSEKDVELLEELKNEIKETEKEMFDYKAHIAGERLYQYVWKRLADVIIEESKPILANKESSEAISRSQFLLYALNSSLRALHPFMPFLTEEIWQSTFKVENPLLVESYTV